MKKLAGKTYDCAAGCPVEAALDLIDGKWKAVIIYHLLDDTIRFNELRRRLSASRNACSHGSFENLRRTASFIARSTQRCRLALNTL